MNRLVFGAGVLMLVPVLSGCGNFYLTAPPDPDPTATPAPTAIAFPFDATQGVGTNVGTAIPLNTPPTTKFRIAIADDIRVVPNRANDPANAYLLLILQKVTQGTATTSAPTAPGAPAAAAATSTVYIGSTRDANYPYHLGGIIVPGATGNVGGGLQDPDQRALLAQASTKMRQTLETWLINTSAPVSAPGSTPVPTPTVAPTPAGRPRRGAVVVATPVPLPSLINPEQLIDVVQDPQFPVDTNNRPMVQVFFDAPRGSKALPKGTRLSLNRMLVRSGLAVVDLYSPTSFDQKQWILDEAYARSRRMGLWGMQINGKGLVLQQRVPAPSTGTGALSKVPVTSNAPKQGAPIGSATPVTSATQSPATLTPTVRPLPATIPRVVPKSGTSIQRGPSNKAILPPPSAGVAPAAPAQGTGPGAGGVTNSPA